MVTSKEVYSKGDLPRQLLPCLHPCGEPLLTHAATGDPPTLAGSFGSVSCGASAPFLWVLAHARFCVCPPRLESLFPPVLWKSCSQIPLAFKVRFPLCWGPRLGSLTSGSEPSQQCENSFGATVLQFGGHPPGRHGMWCCHDCTPTILLQPLLCLWTWGIFFWWVPASSWWLFNS